MSRLKALASKRRKMMLNPLHWLQSLSRETVGEIMLGHPFKDRLMDTRQYAIAMPRAHYRRRRELMNV